MPCTSPESSAFPEFVLAGRAEIAVALDRWLPRPPACPPTVAEAMRYAVGTRGKRLRPLLTLAAAETVAAADRRDQVGRATARRDALPAACAIEFVHTLSLVHDDLPAMDDDAQRRGQPAAHVRFGEGLAILAGDGLLAEAFSLLAREPRDDADPSLTGRKLRTIEAIASAIGPHGMAAGQATDLALTGTCHGAAPPLDLHGLVEMHRRKTGALMQVAAASGAIMAGAPPAHESAVSAFAERLGLAYQIVDDVLDDSCPVALGKTAGKDARRGKPTFPILLGVGESRRMAVETIDEAIAILERANLASDALVGLARAVLERLD